MTVTMLEIGNPLWEDVENAIRKLDGATKDTVALRAYDEHLDALSMEICGDGIQFTVMICDRKGHHILADPRRAAGEVEIDFPGGQIVEWPARQVVDLPTVLVAARAFMQTGEPDSSLCWDDE